ncbi:hypothetical protein GCM10011490_03740 [Pseudoclavibacter endophyticus]|uniref:Uncharacterized protein n=1 Tax=Pseudoclavibacter endophyticus TaxID=1778590 RepID=A0A6H9WTU8_9MICO|nr:HGxxPAAW family protein [Pseudoclavibacter endophyticus]KAB1650105.1 hypothetical protein F8O04_07845 [Pseudoclavibacter endophyticus]GGA57188.1 hypothetical protein GCM10011490_03740 [Pseudoclavibacter endophyticus]
MADRSTADPSMTDTQGTTDAEGTSIEAEHHDDEGHSIIGWVCVLTMIVGFLIGTVSFYLAIEVAVWVGVGITLLGAIMWPILKAAGVGEKDD